MKKFFNTAGPIKPENHYHIPPLERWDLDEITVLIEQEKYFVLHAPRQTGKTSCLLALMEHLNKEGKFKALYVNVEVAQTARDDVSRGVQAILGTLANQERAYLKENILDKNWYETFQRNSPDQALNSMLTLWVENSSKPTVLLIDEVDALVGDTLISVLRQIRTGYTSRPLHFPQSIILCGVRDVRDYRIHSSKHKEIITGGSAFNIKAESMCLGNFTSEEVKSLYLQHTTGTGQKFDEEVFHFIYELTNGQPWLVNALAYEACFKIKENRDRTKTITKEIMEEAKENIILRRDTHIDQLIDKLSDERVRKIIEPLLENEDEIGNAPTDDLQYVIDLGLIRKDEKKIIISNGIYREIIPRELTYTTQLTIHHETPWYIDKITNKLQMKKLLAAFQDFYREHSEHWLKGMQYKESGPQLLLQAFLQRIVNGGGRVEREYGLGRKRTDLYIRWFYDETDKSKSQKIVIECKVIRKSKEATIEEGLIQTIEYKDKCGAEEAYLILFEKSQNKTWEEKVFQEDGIHNNYTIPIWGM
ncbi:MAG: AAA-like domain-containing protein [Leptospiraceae bacterium]|nr:AAA-like domain-containing protein [Leptospiraceae bacterium]MCP5497559.1 AAA-like domain-containing protein [Leptospiraceae bacterium]